MTKRIICFAALALALMPAAAQETYENAKIATEDLNGTARYIGMGGAMEALGTDISTISTNPAGIGLCRKSSFSLSAGLVSQQDAQNFGGGHTTNVSFDQIGFVWANQVSPTSHVNFAFNYHKSRNFNQILSASGLLSGAAQNKCTSTKQDNGLLYGTKADGSPDFDRSYSSCTIVDDLYSGNLNYNLTDNQWYYFNGEENYVFNRSHSGYIGEYDFNLSGNSNNTFYWGITVGLHDVHYSHFSEHSENLIGGYGSTPRDLGVTIADDRIITGTGADIKVGAIFRPIAESPFRFGVSVATPTWYDLTTSAYVTYNDNTGLSDSNTDEYKFKLYTPWKFGLSAGHTIGTNLALGLSYEFADYSSLDSRQYSDGYYDSYSDTRSDTEMNRHTEKTLKGVSTLKVGAEFKPDPAVAVRLGYNYVSPMYDKDGYKDSWISSMGSYHSSNTDFTNWEATHRITCGLGVQLDKWNLAFAYQYNIQKGTFYPFDSYYDNTDTAYDNVVDGVTVKNKRQQLLLTLSYTF